MAPDPSERKTITAVPPETKPRQPDDVIRASASSVAVSINEALMEERRRTLAACVSRVDVWMRFSTAFPMLPAFLSGARQPVFLLALHARKHLTASIYNVLLLNQASAEEVCTGVHVCSDSFHTRVAVASLRAPQIGSDIHREERPCGVPWSSQSGRLVLLHATSAKPAHA